MPKQLAAKEQHPYVAELVNVLAPHANPVLASPMAKYMKDLFPFLGIKSPERRALLAEFVKRYGLPPIADIEAVTQQLWLLPEREYQYCAMDLLYRMKKQLTLDHLPLLEWMVLEKSWWDSVDMISDKLIGLLLLRYPKQIYPNSQRWMDSGNLWLQRTALLFQMKYKAKTDTELLFNNIRACAASKEFFIRKAIGWALREYSYVNPQMVIDFVAQEPLSPLSQREALKGINRKLARTEK